MKRLKNNYRKIMSSKYWPAIASISIVIVAGFFLTMCFTILSVDQPSTATAGERITITLEVEVLEDQFQPGSGSVGGTTLVLGFLAPESWDAGENTTITVSSPVFSTTMSYAPDLMNNSNSSGVQPWAEFLELVQGYGENYGKMEWVIFEADESYQIQPDEVPLYGSIVIETTVGMENMITQLGYFIGEQDNGFWEKNNNWSFFFTPCMEVTGGEGEIINLCGPAPLPETIAVTPDSYSWNDLVNIRFDATKGVDGEPTRLQGASQVYLCAVAHYETGTIEVCDKSDATAFNFQGEDIWTLTIWPMELFNIPEDTLVTQITYTLENLQGNISVQNPDSGEDFIMIADCN